MSYRKYVRRDQKPGRAMTPKRAYDSLNLISVTRGRA
jgi:hypothetical protein